MVGGDSSNPVRRTLAELASTWEAFTAEPEPRLLRWIVDDDSRQMVETFILTEADEAGTTADLFVVFENPFEEPAGYAELRRDGAAAFPHREQKLQCAGRHVFSSWLRSIEQMTPSTRRRMICSVTVAVRSKSRRRSFHCMTSVTA